MAIVVYVGCSALLIVMALLLGWYERRRSFALAPQVAQPERKPLVPAIAAATCVVAFLVLVMANPQKGIDNNFQPPLVAKWTAHVDPVEPLPSAALEATFRELASSYQMDPALLEKALSDLQVEEVDKRVDLKKSLYSTRPVPRPEPGSPEASGGIEQAAEALGFGELSNQDAVILFASMLVGMFSKALWDIAEAHRHGQRPRPLGWSLLGPAVVAPMVFIGVCKATEIQSLSILTMCFAYQNGFTWQTVLGRIPAGEPEREPKRRHPGGPDAPPTALAGG